MKRFSGFGYGVAIALVALVLQSCGDSYDVIPSPSLKEYKYAMYDSTVHDYYIPEGDTVARDTMYTYTTATTVTFKFDLMRGYAIIGDDTLRPKVGDTTGFWGKGVGSYDHSTQLIFNADSLKINRWGQSNTPQLMKQLCMKGNPLTK